jgi:hypothetical protein
VTIPGIPPARIWKRVEIDPAGCWIWTGARSADGYGKTKIDGRTVRVHRWAYRYFRGPIPEGLQLDHLCRVRACCNPNHLEAVTCAENIRRGDTGRYFADRTECPAGHPYDAANTYRDPRGSRRCRACHRARSREWAANRVRAGR